MTPPLLASDDPRLDPRAVPPPVFLLASGTAIAVDGDTLGLKRPGERRLRRDAPRIRLRSVGAPEMPRARAEDAALRSVGIDPLPRHPGIRARAQLAAFVEGAALLVEVDPARPRDRHGRLLADVAAMPIRDGRPSLAEAISLERLLLARGHVEPRPGAALPPLRPLRFAAAPGLRADEALAPTAPGL